jgi:GAF domain-containing protein
VEPADLPVFQHPLAVGDEPIGAVEIAGDVDETAAGLVGAIADRLSHHLETLRLAEQSQQRAQEMELLSRIGQAIISQPDLQGLLRVAGDTILQGFGADQGYIALSASDKGWLEFPYYRVDGERLNWPAAPLGDSVNSVVIRSGEPLLINRDIDRRMAELGVRTMGVEHWPRAWLGVPILAGQQVIGLISVQSREREDAFTEAGMRLLTTITANLSTAIQNARLFAEAQKRANREATINAISQKIQSATSVEGALQAAARAIGEMLKVQRTIVEIGHGTPQAPAGNGHN